MNGRGGGGDVALVYHSSGGDNSSGDGVVRDSETAGP